MKYSIKQLTCEDCKKTHYRWGKLCGTCYNRNLKLRSPNYVVSLKKYSDKRSNEMKKSNSMIKSCIKCGKDFCTGYRLQKRCKQCVIRPMVNQKIECLVCKKHFFKKRQKQVHCSAKCYCKTFYYKRDREKVRFYNRRREMLDRGAKGSFTLLEWLDIKNKFKNRCNMCKKHESENKLTIDHIIPISRGGTNYKENIQPLCKSCNSKKGNKIYAI